MTHADVIRAARDAVVEAANEWHQCPHGTASRLRLHASVDAFRAAELAACPACRGCGRISMQPAPGARGVLFGVCPACHGTGRKPDTFRDDGATTPEGFEDPDDRGGEVPGA